mgnify:CR=1 FL=1
MRGVFLEHILMGFDGDAAEDGFRSQIVPVLTEALELLGDLVGQFPGVAEHQRAHGTGVLLHAVQH